jgi:hypothetical protein
MDAKAALGYDDERAGYDEVDYFADARPVPDGWERKVCPCGEAFYGPSPQGLCPDCQADYADHMLDRYDPADAF